MLVILPRTTLKNPSRLFSTKPIPTTTVKRSAPSPWLFLGIFTAGCSTFGYITHKRSQNNTDPRLRSKALPSFGGAPTVQPTSNSKPLS
ncbi:hypothetical protein MJO28_010209 [Puccinia striiformis f. sp. tritici]|uniref:Uncharacterized protein n=1 Tax=Puccinia striiformis f. sp. tritici TaxID=168172 RepID=A0ACC0E5G2_9BASI|nr:hypothetical protein Pst134EA_019014 [Puccinia striiformis f. sp. tritici]KAH9449083.1 hypothetical protein Pst134EB_019918 [Puccinia striiformis f. sp. tritici]KAH9458860.1 hypothetical protein Pst134EA_019014 [Puccinia striiformis f. sp. tritici]KAI7944514.1 hypothetical protein MJO28_010209 [Puccinia striiformis f. sp. tritici]KAI7948280.1 hypothetical protein MJO29_009945 [Puccinia striiformis f. sp. tritici]